MVGISTIMVWCTCNIYTYYLNISRYTNSGYSVSHTRTDTLVGCITFVTTWLQLSRHNTLISRLFTESGSRISSSSHKVCNMYRRFTYIQVLKQYSVDRMHCILSLVTITRLYTMYVMVETIGIMYASFSASACVILDIYMKCV